MRTENKVKVCSVEHVGTLRDQRGGEHYCVHWIKNRKLNCEIVKVKFWLPLFFFDNTFRKKSNSFIYFEHPSRCLMWLKACEVVTYPKQNNVHGEKSK